MKYITDTMIEEMKRRCEAYLEAREKASDCFVRNIAYRELRATSRDVILFAKVLGTMEDVSIFDLNSEPKGDGAQ